MTSGSITVVADSRLNRLIAQGTASDIERIEEYLKIVDKDNSITSVETYGTSHVIELMHTKASEVAAAIRDAYAGRIAASPARGTLRPSAHKLPQRQPPGRGGSQAGRVEKVSQKQAGQPPRPGTKDDDRGSRTEQLADRHRAGTTVVRSRKAGHRDRLAR